MTTAFEAAPALPIWKLRWRQLWVVVRLEMRQELLRRRSLVLYLLALLPVGIFAARALLASFTGRHETVAGVTGELAKAFQSFLLPMVIFFSCAFIFANLVRREIVERTLHYGFLAPLRREVLLVGKYLAGVIAAFLLFGASTAATFLLAYLPVGRLAISGFLLRGGGLVQLAAYLGVTLLAVIGYGAFFLAVGALLKSPAIPAFVLFGWESILFLLPPLLKKLSFAYYLRALCPVPVSEGPLALLADSPARLPAVLGLLLLSAALLALAAWRLRRTEILYGED